MHTRVTAFAFLFFLGTPSAVREGQAGPVHLTTDRPQRGPSHEARAPPRGRRERPRPHPRPPSTGEAGRPDTPIPLWSAWRTVVIRSRKTRPIRAPNRSILSLMCTLHNLVFKKVATTLDRCYIYVLLFFHFFLYPFFSKNNKNFRSKKI